MLLYDSIVSKAQVLRTVGRELLSIDGSSREHLMVAGFNSVHGGIAENFWLGSLLPGKLNLV